MYTLVLNFEYNSISNVRHLLVQVGHGFSYGSWCRNSEKVSEMKAINSSLVANAILEISDLSVETSF